MNGNHVKLVSNFIAFLDGAYGATLYFDQRNVVIGIFLDDGAHNCDTNIGTIGFDNLRP